MLIPSFPELYHNAKSSLSRGMNANSQPHTDGRQHVAKSIKRDEC